MKKRLLLLAVLTLSFTPSFVLAQESPSPCVADPQICESEPVAFDVRIIKEVSVAGSAFMDANSLATAPTAYSGESVVWRITASVVSDTPAEGFAVQDILPSEVQYVSSNSSDYDASTGIWMLPTMTAGQTYALEITTKTIKEGQIINHAEIGRMQLDETETNEIFAGYEDADTTNNSDNAYIKSEIKPGKLPQVLGESTSTPSVSTPIPTPTPQVLGESTLTNTGGNSFIGSLVALGIIVFCALLYKFSTNTDK